MIPCTRQLAPFPYTTLFRSQARPDAEHRHPAVPDAPTIRSAVPDPGYADAQDRKSTRLNSSHRTNSYAVFCLKKKTNILKSAFSSQLSANLRNRLLVLAKQF